MIRIDKLVSLIISGLLLEGFCCDVVVSFAGVCMLTCSDDIEVVWGCIELFVVLGKVVFCFCPQQVESMVILPLKPLT